MTESQIEAVAGRMHRYIVYGRAPEWDFRAAGLAVQLRKHSAAEVIGRSLEVDGIPLARQGEVAASVRSRLVRTRLVSEIIQPNVWLYRNALDELRIELTEGRVASLQIYAIRTGRSLAPDPATPPQIPPG
jgi:hypothetical protein